MKNDKKEIKEKICKDKGWNFIRDYEKHHTIQEVPQNSRYNIFFKSLHRDIMMELVKAARERKAKFIRNSDRLTANLSFIRNTEATRKYMFDVLKIQERYVWCIENK